MIQTTQAIIVPFKELIEKFEELTGWQSNKNGLYNADQSKPIVFLIDFEKERQYEQFYLQIILNPNVTENPNSILKKETLEYVKNNTIHKAYRITINDMISWMILKNEIQITPNQIILIK